jgi:hypothetical protein
MRPRPSQCRPLKTAGGCVANCYLRGGLSTVARLTAVPDPGLVFAGWEPRGPVADPNVLDTNHPQPSGCDSVNGSTCTIRVDPGGDVCCPLGFVEVHILLYSVRVRFGVGDAGPHEGYCVPTLERGWTFVELGVDQHQRDPYWSAVFATRAPIVLSGHQVTPVGPPVLAALVPGVGLTCDQPHFPYATGSPYGRRDYLPA